MFENSHRVEDSQQGPHCCENVSTIAKVIVRLCLPSMAHSLQITVLLVSAAVICTHDT